jgi:tetratricopeptide (TPR) repeat protein
LIAMHKKLAGELVNNRLYQSAVDEYKEILELPGVDETTRANIYYLIGKIYYENLKEYDKAAGYYVRANSLDPNASFSQTASENLVASLEKMGRMMDASRELSSITTIDTAAPEPGDVKVASINDDPIWLSELDAAIQRLPASIQKQYQSHAEKAKFLRQYVAAEMMYRAAIREGYDKDPEIKKRYEAMLHDLLVSKYLSEKVMSQEKIDTSDVRNFYVANKDSLYDGKDFEDVKSQVYSDYQNQKAQQLLSSYLEKFMRAEKVKFFDENVS